MKTPARLLCLFGLSLAVPTVLAADVVGDSLQIGTNNVFTSTVLRPAFVGEYNTIDTDGVNSLLVGSFNYISYAYDSVIIGSDNTGDSDTMLCVGHSNNIYGMSGMTFGDFNYAFTYPGVVAGNNNSIEGRLQFAFGRGLINHANSWATNAISIYLGQYNVSSASSTPPLLVVGNGTDAAHPANALEIARDGKAKFNNSLEIFAANYNPANANSGKIVVQPSTGGSSMTIDGRAVLMASLNGNVGIGLSSPNYLLDLGNASIDADGSASFAGGTAWINSEGVLNGSGAEFGRTSATNGFWLYPGYIPGDGVAGVNTSDGSASFANGNATIDATGYVTGNGFNSAADSYLDGVVGYYLTTYNFSTGGRALSIDYYSRDLYDKDGSTPVLSWGHGNGSATFGGNVGIGASSPAAKLAVNGNAALGTGVTSAASQVVVGKYNDVRTNDAGVDHTQGVFIVGSGTGTGASAANSIRVLTDGTVLVKKSGNLAMGSFTSGPRP